MKSLPLDSKREELIAMEWFAFQHVNNAGGRADCQDDLDTFLLMRRAQYSAWPDELVSSFARDMSEASISGRNLIAEKYAWMMESTAPEEFEAIKGLLPALSEEAESLIARIMEIYNGWTAEYFSRCPLLSSNGRPARSSGDSGGTSIETYMRGELRTYSLRTLRLFLDHAQQLKSAGRNLALMIMDYTVKQYGYADADDAERRLAAARGGRP